MSSFLSLPVVPGFCQLSMLVCSSFVNMLFTPNKSRMCAKSTLFISHLLNGISKTKQTIHIKSNFCTKALLQVLCLKIVSQGGIWTGDLLFLKRISCHSTSQSVLYVVGIQVCVSGKGIGTPTICLVSYWYFNLVRYEFYRQFFPSTFVFIWVTPPGNWHHNLFKPASSVSFFPKDSLLHLFFSLANS
jgi:hypothetical protein